MSETINAVPFSLDEIRKQIWYFTKSNYGKNPDYIMMHICNKRKVAEEMSQMSGKNFYDLFRCEFMGIKVIWTNDIGENDIICTITQLKL